ncbi:MAG: SdpI family protein [Eubacteriales bacterium]|nr:SdpI family protein [Eubacteriales bacterium]
MLKENKRTLIVTSVVTILPILAGLFLWDRLPDPMATHFGMNNQANGFSSKIFAVFGIPLFCLAMEWVMAVVTSGDPRKKNISRKLFVLCLWIIPVVSLVCAAVIYPYNLGIPMDISFFMELLLGAMFIVVGNYLPKTRQNYTIGIKMPWTLANEENWNRTHRMGGYLWIAGGFVLIVLTLTGRLQGAWLVGISLFLAFVPCIYSWWLHVRNGL